MFGKTEKRAMEEQKEILQNFLNDYGIVLEECQRFFKSYRTLNLYVMEIAAGNIHAILSKKISSTISELNKLERIITGKYVECDMDSFNFFITGKINYLLFREFKKQKNGNIINTGKSYEKKFKGLERKDVIEEIIPLHTGGDVAKEKEI